MTTRRGATDGKLIPSYAEIAEQTFGTLWQEAQPADWALIVHYMRTAPRSERVTQDIRKCKHGEWLYNHCIHCDAEKPLEPTARCVAVPEELRLKVLGIVNYEGWQGTIFRELQTAFRRGER